MRQKNTEYHKGDVDKEWDSFTARVASNLTWFRSSILHVTHGFPKADIFTHLTNSVGRHIPLQPLHSSLTLVRTSHFSLCPVTENWLTLSMVALQEEHLSYRKLLMGENVKNYNSFSPIAGILSLNNNNNNNQLWPFLSLLNTVTSGQVT